MSKKEEKPLCYEVNITFSNKAQLKKFVEEFGKTVGVEQGAELKTSADKAKKENAESEPFIPKEGDICAYLNDEGEPEALFRSNGNHFSDEDGDLIFEADKSVQLSDNIMKPFMIVTGEDQQFPGEHSRKATKEEVECFSELTKRAEKNEGKKWNVGDWVYVVSSETGCSQVFFSLPVTYADTKTMENLARRGWIFHTDEECQAVCDKLNEGIKNVK